MTTLYTGAMLQKDMATARAAWIQEGKTPGEQGSRTNSEFLVDDGSRGVVDLHALRHSFISALAMVAPLKTTQSLARHSDPKLTLNIYSHLADEAQTDALAKLPSQGRPTGTAD
jgi:integrase